MLRPDTSPRDATISVSAATLADSGPLLLIVDASIELRILQLQLFIATVCLLTLPVAIVLAQRSRLAERLRDRELSYRMLADHSRDFAA